MSAADGDKAGRREAVRQRLRDDYIFYPEKCLWIVNKQGKLVRFVLSRPQRRLNRGLMAQRAAGQPMRGIVCKSRQVGFSTDTQGMVIQRTTQQENHLAAVLAQDRLTAGALFEIGKLMWTRLPPELKPPAAQIADTLDRKFIKFGEPSQQLRKDGVLGLNSRIIIATPKGLTARGMTPRSLQISEFAHWPVTELLLGIINGVPDDPDTLVIIESTPKGHNHFKDHWDLAVAGASGYIAFFSPWYEDGQYRRPFANEQDREEFVLGAHPRYGEEEPGLYEQILGDLLEWALEDGDDIDQEALELRALEHIHWRRWAIAAKCEGSIEKFHQEYPSTAEEGFLSTGQRVFDAAIVKKILKRCERTDPVMPTAENPGPVVGLFRVVESKAMTDRTGQKIDVATKVKWVPKAHALPGEKARWRLWAAPQQEHEHAGERVPSGQYLAFCDPASGEIDDKGVKHAEHAIEVIDHRTRRQVAEWIAQEDPDLCALEILKVALYFNEAWVNVEKTGGYGLSMLRKIRLDYHYPRVYTDESKDRRTESRNDRLGWSTDSVTKPLMEAQGIELLRLEKDGIRSAVLPRQMLTFIRDERGRTKPEPGHRSDGLMAWLGVQLMAKIRPIRPDTGQSSKPKKPPRRGGPGRRGRR